MEKEKAINSDLHAATNHTKRKENGYLTNTKKIPLPFL